jgi:cyanophycinase
MIRLMIRMKHQIVAVRIFWIICALHLPALLAAQGSILLVGGGSEEYNDWSDAPYRWFVEHAPNRKVLVMHYSTGSAWLEGYFRSFGADSASSLVVVSTAMANDSAVYRKILAADGIFLRGGDQYQYISTWKGTLTEKAIREVFQRGGVIGGTSAGEAVLSQVIFDARVASVDPRAALRNPLFSGISFTENFLGFATGLLADSHFFERGRLGRLPAMMALYKLQTGKEITGAGVDYNTAFAIDSDGKATVMGSGTVTLLRFAPSTQLILESSKPLSLSKMMFDQLTDGFTYHTVTGVITAPLSAVPFSARSVVTAVDSLWIDGSGSRNNWYSGIGSLKKLSMGMTDTKDTVGILTTPVSAEIAGSIDSCLKQWSIPSKLLWIDGAHKNDPTLSESIARCAAFVFAGNNGDSIALLLNRSTAAGDALFKRFSQGAHALFLGNDGILAADNGVWSLEKNIYGAYYGYLTRIQGINTVSGMSIVPRLFEASDYIDNRASGLFWSMARSNDAFGVLLDAGTFISIAGKTMKVFGPTPAMVIDARGATTVDFPSWKDPGKLNPRQNAALIGAQLHIVRDGQEFDLSVLSAAGKEMERPLLPESMILEQNFPNPFNPVTTIRYMLPSSAFITVSVYDVLGREVAVIERTFAGSGTMHQIQFDASGLTSGIYVVRLTNGTDQVQKKMVLIR